MSDEEGIGSAREKVEQTLKREFNGGPIPDRFVTGRPSTSVTYHTKVCYRVANHINMHTSLQDSPEPTLKEVGDQVVEWHDLVKCDACSTIESPAERKGQDP